MGFFLYMGLWACQPSAPEITDTAQVPGTQVVLEDCAPSSVPDLQIAQEGPYGLKDGDPLWFGLPPQGGVPYAPFRFRIDGLNAAERGTSVSVVATDADSGERLGDIELVHRFVCANVGEDAGSYVAGEIHLRFWDYRLKELDGRTAEVVATVEDSLGLPSVSRYKGPMMRLPD
jgi:hypothetical protein